MDALIRTVSAGGTTNDTLFQTTSGRHDLIVFNDTVELSATVYIKANEGTSGETVVIRKKILQGGEDFKYHGSIGSDDSIVVTTKNDNISTIVLTQSGNELQTEDGVTLGVPNDVYMNYSYQTRG